LVVVFVGLDGVFVRLGGWGGWGLGLSGGFCGGRNTGGLHVVKDDGLYGGLGWDVIEDGRYGAVDFVVDEFFDEGGLGCGLGQAAVGVGVAGWEFAGEEAGEDLEVVEEAAGSCGVEVVGGDAAEDLRGDGEGGGAVLDDGELEGLVGVEVTEFSGVGFGAAGGVVEVAEALAAERGRAALAAGGVDVAALDAALGYGDEFS
jgi:hypothetical protein